MPFKNTTDAKKDRLYIILYTKIKYFITKEYTWKNKHLFLVQCIVKNNIYRGLERDVSADGDINAKEQL